MGAARQGVRRARPRGLWSRRTTRGRRRCAVRAGAEMRPICIAFARRPKSCGPDARRWRQGTERLHADRPQESKVRTLASAPLSPDGDEPKRINRHRGEHEASRKPTACGTPDVSVLSWFLTHALFTFAHEAADASCVRRSARPRLWRGEGAGRPFAPTPSAPPRRSNNRGDAACLHPTQRRQAGMMTSLRAQARRANAAPTCAALSSRRVSRSGAGAAARRARAEWPQAGARAAAACPFATVSAIKSASSCRIPRSRPCIV